MQTNYFSPKVFGKNNYGWFTDEVIKFGHTNRTLENLQSMSYCYLASYVGPHIDFGWNPFANTFKAYLKMPKRLNISPNALPKVIKSFNIWQKKIRPLSTIRLITVKKNESRASNN